MEKCIDDFGKQKKKKCANVFGKATADTFSILVWGFKRLYEGFVNKRGLKVVIQAVSG